MTPYCSNNLRDRTEDWSMVLYIKSGLYFCPTWTGSFGALGTQLWSCFTHPWRVQSFQEKAAASENTLAGEGDLVVWDVFIRSGRSPDAEGSGIELPNFGKIARRFLLIKTKLLSFYWGSHSEEMITAFTISKVEMCWEVNHITSPQEKKRQKRMYFLKKTLIFFHFFDHVRDIKTHCEVNLNI